MEDEMELDGPSDAEVRLTALEYAVAVADINKLPVDGDTIVKRAELFYNFLKGDTAHVRTDQH